MSSAINSTISLPPPHLLLFELLGASAVIGCTPSRSSIRPAILPVLCTCSYCIIRDARLYMRPRWASLLGGFTVAVLFRYLDLGLIRRWNFEDRGPAPSPSVTTPASIKSNKSASSFFSRLTYGWNTLWSFRHVNTPYEVKHVPHFSSSDPSYVPSKWRFIAQQAAAGIACYLVLDLLAQRAPPVNAAQLFDPALIPVFARWRSVTVSDLRLRALTISGFAVTFFCIIQGTQSLAGALAVGTGVSKVEDWRPAFGDIKDAYCLKNVWGKFWHQLLRRSLTAPPSFLVHDVLQIPRYSTIAGIITLVSSFALSGVLHAAAGVASGSSLNQIGVFRFFCTQALGVVMEQGVVTGLRKLQGTHRTSNENENSPSWYVRVAGYAWVMAFMTWTGPSWIYPQAARVQGQGATAFLPFSVIGFVKNLR